MNISPLRNIPLGRGARELAMQFTAAVERARAKELWAKEMRYRNEVSRLESLRVLTGPSRPGRLRNEESEFRVYRETVIIDDDRILIGVLTGESDPWPLRQPAG